MYSTSFADVFISNDIRKYDRNWKNIVFEIFFKKTGHFGQNGEGPGILKIAIKSPKIIENRQEKKFWVFFRPITRLSHIVFSIYDG